MMALLIQVQKLVWSLGANLPSLSFFGLNGWGKRESIAIFSGMWSLGTASMGATVPSGGPCDAAVWPTGARGRIPVCSTSRTRALADGKDFWPSLPGWILNAMGKKKKKRAKRPIQEIYPSLFR